MSKLKPFNSEGIVEKLSWEKPERRDQAGSILIFGGASLKLKSVDLIYKKVRELGSKPTVLIPESLAKGFKVDLSVMSAIKFDNYFGLTEEGQKTLTEEFAMTDALILADSGKNSSTTNRLARAISHSFKPLIITEGSLSLILNYPEEFLHSPNLTILATASSLQKIQRSLSKNLEFPVKLSSGPAAKLNSLLEFQEIFRARFILFEDGLILAVDSEKNEYLLQKSKISQEHFSANLACWQIWAPKAAPLEQLLLASKVY